jgi:hypothetical protein
MTTRDFDVYTFDSIQHKVGEPFVSFVDRLRYQASKCEFENENFEIKRKIIASCRQSSLRKYAFERPKLLEQVIEKGKSLERAANTILCLKCGGNYRMCRKDYCPAQKHWCAVCKKIGHLENVCFSLTQPIRNKKRQRRSMLIDELLPAKRQAAPEFLPEFTGMPIEVLQHQTVITPEPNDVGGNWNFSESTSVGQPHHENDFELFQ